MKKIFQKFPAVGMVILGLVSMAWRAFEKQGLTKRRYDEKTRGDAMFIAMRDMEGLISRALQIDMSSVNEKPSDEEGGAIWLDPESN